MKRSILFFALAAAIVMVLAGCSLNGGSSTLSFTMTDANASDVKEVWLAVSEVQLLPADGAAGIWTTLSTDVQDIELLSARDNPVTFIDTTVVPPGQYGQLRLIVERAWIVWNDDTESDLFVPSGAETGYKVLLKGFDFQAGGVYDIILDFDVARSLVDAKEDGRGYLWQPTCRAAIAETVAWVTGAVNDNEDNPMAEAQVDIVSDADGTTYTVYTDDAGLFRANAIPAGSYTVTVTKDSMTEEVAGVAVEAGAETALGDIIL